MKQYIELGKDILLIKNSVEDPNRLYEIIKKSKGEDVSGFGPWTDWKPWGFYSKAYPEQDREWENKDDDGSYFIKETTDSFWDAIRYYKENLLNREYFSSWGYDSDIPTSFYEMYNSSSGWYYGDLLVAESLNTNPEKRLSMEYHLDRRMWLNGQPSFFNYNIYINDDYEGGEIQFLNLENMEKSTYIDKDGKDRECYLVEDPLTYRMQAGDGMLFRTDVPHAVLPIKGHKYYVRHFLMAPEPLEWKNMRESLDPEYFAEKAKEIEIEGFKNQWSGKLFASKEEASQEWEIEEKTKIYILKSGNYEIAPKRNRFSYSDNEESPMANYLTDPLYVYNTRKPDIEQ
jgi:hypothetical protein